MTLRLFVACFAIRLVSLSSQNSTPKISHPIVLLPDDPRATFEITAENGCFDFSTDREDLLNLTPKQIDDKCIRSVIVNLKAPIASTDSGSARAVVIATETTTKSELRSEVYFSSISRVEILTRIRRLSVGELEAIQVQAYDKFGNTFSSLEGVPFSWLLTDPSTGKKSQIVGIVPLKSTEYALSQERIGLEEKGKQSDLLIVVGWKPGKTTISVSVPSTSITSIPVSMSVVENFYPKPSSIAIPFCGHSVVSLFTRAGPITLPDPAYSFGIPAIVRSSVLINADGKISSLNSSSPIQTSVSITDTRTVGENEESVRVCIGRPTDLEIVPSVLFPVANEKFQIKLVARSSDCPKMEMELSADADISFSVSSDVATPTRLSPSLWEIDGLPKGSKITASASLDKIASPTSGCTWKPENPITAKQVTIETVERVVVSERQVILPENQKFFSINVRGGSGQYRAISESPECTVSFHNSVMSMTNCAGSISVEDLKNQKNLDEIVIHRVPVSGGHYRLGSNSTLIEAFIGFEKPFIDSIAFENFHNCSELIQSITVSNETIAKVVFANTSEPKTCGSITVTQLVPGKTDLVIRSVSGTIEKIPIIVHSPFKIKPEIRLFNASVGAVVAVNASLGFNVAGGSLGTLRLPRNEELIILSHPWVVDVVTDVGKNKFRVVCKTIGKSSVAIAYSKTSAVAIECVGPKSVIIGPIDIASIGSPSDALFVTCGHKENHVMRAIGVDSRGDKIDSMVYDKILWNRKESSSANLVIPPMECNTENLIEVELRLKNGKVLKSKATVKARNTVRSTLGPLLTSKPIYIPCEDSQKSRHSLSLGFVGGSGYYAIVDDETDSGFVVSKKDSSTISIGPVGSFNVRFSNELCGKKLRTLTVEDTQLKDEKTGKVQLQVRQLPVIEFSASIAPESPSIILRNEWVAINREIKFSDGTVMDSETDGKWFASTTGLFQWTSDVPSVELMTEDSGILSLKYSGNEPRLSVKISSSSYPNIFATIDIVAMNRPVFQTAFVPKWTLVPFTGNYELSVVGADMIENVMYDFESDNDRIRLVRVSQLSVLIEPTASGSFPAAVIRFVGKSSDSGREIFSVSQEIETQSPLSQILINDRSTRDPLIVHRNVAVPFFVNGEFVVPPVDLGVDSCTVTWAIGTETLDVFAQSISHTFTNIGDFPVKVTVQCEHLGPAADARISVRVIDPDTSRRIPPLAILMAGKVEYENKLISAEPFITPEDEGSLVVKVSDSEMGVVLFKSLTRAELDNLNDITLLVGSTRHVNVVIKDSLGFNIEVPKNLEGLTVGSSRPSVVDVAGGSTISITGRSAGCAIVFAHLERILIGLIRVCVQNSIVPFADTFVLTKHSSMTVRSAESMTNLIRLKSETFSRLMSNLGIVESSLSNIDLAKKEIQVVGDIETVLGQVGIDEFEFVYPNANQWTIESNGKINITNHGVVEKLPEGPAWLSLGPWTRIPIQVSSITRLIPSPDKTFPKFISLNQFGHQSLSFLPVTREDKILTSSPFIDHKLKFDCRTDASEFFDVKPALMKSGDDNSVVTCVISPIVSALSWVPKKITLTVCLLTHSVCENFSLSLEAHFHIVSGDFKLPVPAELSVASDTVQLTITHLAPGSSIADCQVIQRTRFVEVSPVSEEGWFSVTRTNPSVSESKITVICKSQQVDFSVKFFAVSDKTSEFSQSYDFSDSVSYAVYNLVWYVLKIVASVLAVAGVAYLFQRTRPQLAPSIVKEKKSFGRLTSAASPKEFTPLPHPDKDTFFGGSSITRRSHID